MEREELAKKLMEHVGGIENIKSLSHCMTRLRFFLVDDGKVCEEELKKLPILGVQRQGGQYQVIVGNDVSRVYKELVKQYPKLGGENLTDQAGEKKGTLVSRMLAALTAILVMPLSAVIGSGLIMGIRYMFTTLHILPAESPLIFLLTVIGNSSLYFFPFLLAVSAAKRFHTNVYMAIGIAAAMLDPNLIARVGEEPVRLFGALPIPMNNYGSSVIPIILAVWFMSKVYGWLEEKLPSMVTVIFAPLLTFLIVTPVNLILIAPLATYLTTYVSNGLEWLINLNLGAAGFVIGATRPLLVLVGLHHAIRPLQYMQLETFGYTTISPATFISTMSQATAAFATAVLVKDRKNKQIATSSAVSGYLGITEPALYGIIFKYRAALAGCVIGGGLGGMVSLMMGAKAFSQGMPSILTTPVFMGDKPMSIVCGFAVMFVSTFGITWFLGKSVFKLEDHIVFTDDILKTGAAKEETASGLLVFSPVSGRLCKLEDIHDETFSTEILGKGIGIIPNENRIAAPADGVVNSVFHTNHALGFVTEEGLEVLIHIGLDTVKLEGEFFTPKCKVGDRMKKGDVLIEFDRERIEAAGYDTTVVIVISNTAAYGSIEPEFEEGAIFTGEKILTVK
ncbi:glucose PTS transporter subunit IIA [Lacrimispora celerecrescens]|uniref:PTS beta-glucoside transporter subunit IIABC n=1 Tax=Lacrimispora celerecrescens TaxID=29354 RepID=A0A084JRV9_9FIRM|nr:glucose PTS transporter subunit IIA [Lacrimispora celerecrescens]KEZ91693.1 hypothetical protein IO98_00485 [Lacrimispora celerecrescens]